MSCLAVRSLLVSGWTLSTDDDGWWTMDDDDDDDDDAGADADADADAD